MGPLFCNPRFNQLLGGSESSFDTLTVSGQIEAWHVSVIITLEFRLIYGF